MEMRRFGRWLGRLVAVAAFGMGATAGAAGVAVADGADSMGEATPADADGAGVGIAPADFQWNGAPEDDE